MTPCVSRVGTSGAPNLPRRKENLLPGWRSSALRARGPFVSRRTPMTVLIYVDTSKQVGDRDHLKVFAEVEAGGGMFAENDTPGVAFEYDVIDRPADHRLVAQSLLLCID